VAAEPGLDEYRAIFEHSVDGVLFTAPDGRVLAANESAARLLGRTAVELCEVGRAGLMDSADTRWVPALAERARTGRVRADVRMLRGDGTSVEVEVTSKIFRTATGDERACVFLRDLSARRELEASVRAAERRFHEAFVHAPIGMAIVGLDGRFLEVNESLCRMLGYSAAALMGRTFQDITHPDDLDTDLAYAAQLLAGEIERYRMEKRYYDASGHVVWIELSGSIVRDDQGEPMHFIAQIQDISERRRREDELRRRAELDPLTGLWNRYRLDQELARALHLAGRYGERAAVLLVDLDDFKAVNDQHGHGVGDVLRRIAAAMRTRLRISDVAARLGGDEFVVVLPTTDADRATTVARELRAAIGGTQLVAGGEKAGVGASIGIVLVEEDGDAAEVIRAADRAMYRAKRDGGDCERIAPPLRDGSAA